MTRQQRTKSVTAAGVTRSKGKSPEAELRRARAEQKSQNQCQPPPTQPAVQLEKRTFATKCRRVKMTDEDGKDWFQIVHHCDSHGWNHSHPSDFCEHPKPGHRDDAAGPTVNAGVGSTKNDGKANWWCNHETWTTAPNKPAVT